MKEGTEQFEEVNRVKAFFETATLPESPFILSPGVKVLDVAHFLKVNTNILENNRRGNISYEIGMHHLKQLRNYINKSNGQS